MTTFAVGSASIPAADHPGRADSVSAESVKRLIDDLDSDDRTVREAAVRRLVNFGPAVLPLLPPPERLPNSAVAATVRRIRLELERRQARESVAPSTVTLAETASLERIAEEIAKQTGNGVEISSLSEDVRNRRLSVAWDAATFWTAIEDIINRLGLAWQIDSAQKAVILRPRQPESRNPIAVETNSVYHVAIGEAAVRDIAGETGGRLLRVSLELTAEPRLRPLFLRFEGQHLAARANGRELEPFSPRSKKEIPFGEGGSRVGFTWDFRLPKDIDLASFDLKATATVETAASSERIAFTRLEQAAGTARRRGGVTVTLAEVELEPEAENRGRGRIVAAISYDTGGPAFESHRTWIYHNRAWLEAADGGRVDFAGSTVRLERNGAVAVEYRFDRLPGDAADLTFVYEAPTLLINVPVDIDLADVPLTNAQTEEKAP
ncbi:MAG: hypothetical protein KY476_02230 [Planctomycetes bacterium]|nr:hypothetical protein [Planctomycetota bacterium]